MKIPSKFPAKGWRKVRKGSIIKKGDVWHGTEFNYGESFKAMACIGQILRDNEDVYLYRKLKTKSK